jgi:hypothetical protein
MLTIQNFEKLRYQKIGDWHIDKADTDNYIGQGDGSRYVLTLRMDGADGAAVFIDRKESELSTYSVKIMYEEWDNLIFQRYVDLTQIERKDAFLGMILNAINTEYYSRRKMKP